MIGPHWLKGHNFAVLINGEFSACFSTFSQAEAVARRRAIFHPDTDVRRRIPLPYVVIDRRRGVAVRCETDFEGHEGAGS